MTNAGIWQGRFQLVHNGHVYIFEKELPKFRNKYVAIVNPNPLCPAISGGDFDRFTANLNPFSYFDRMLLWKKVADDKKLSINIVPCWHGRYVIALENEFLPPRTNRSWIIPVAQSDGEENKANDLRNKGELIHQAHSFLEEDDAYAAISASMIRTRRNNGKDDWKRYMPECIAQLTEDLLDKNINHKYIVVPFIGNALDLHGLQGAITLLNQSSEEERFIVFAVSVRVQNGKKEWIDTKPENTPWWFKAADNTYANHNLKFYAKAKMINELMAVLGITNYLVTPIFIMDDSFSTLSEYNGAFLPPAEKTIWVINRQEKRNGNGYYRYGFNAYLTNMDAQTHIINESEIDFNIRSFFNNDSYHKFVNGSQRKITVDTTTYTSLEAKASTIERCLLELVAGSTPPERAVEYLQKIRKLKNRLREGWNSQKEFQQDKETLDEIISWLSNIA